MLVKTKPTTAFCSALSEGSTVTFTLKAKKYEQSSMSLIKITKITLKRYIPVGFTVVTEGKISV